VRDDDARDAEPVTHANHELVDHGARDRVEPVVGSSYRSYFGRSAIARAMPTRFRMPPESSAGNAAQR
jgi:hypothetical protein